MDGFRFLSKSKLNDLPKASGVYCFTEKVAETRSPLIYIGKAINIQSRVKNHFNQPSYRDDLFMDQVKKVGYFETNSEIEALILEANLIKKYQPKFNVVWRDDKNYFYVAIAQNEQKIPYVYITHQPKISNFKFQISNSQFIGPFVEGTTLKKTLRFLRRAFPYYTSKKHSKNKCTWCHLGLCPGPEPDLPEYRKNLKKLILILQGKRKAVLRALRTEMKSASQKKNYEEAGKIRDRINNLEYVMSHAGVIESKDFVKSDLTKSLRGLLGLEKISRIECYDVSNMQGKSATGSMIAFIDGKPDKNSYRKFKIRLKDEPNDIAMLRETIERRLSHKEWQYPEIMLIDGGKGQLNIAIKVREQFHRIIPLIISIAKGRQELFIEGRKGPVPLKNLPQEIQNLILHLDDEAHRFAIAYHKNLRKKILLPK